MHDEGSSSVPGQSQTNSRDSSHVAHVSSVPYIRTHPTLLTRRRHSQWPCVGLGVCVDGACLAWRLPVATKTIYVLCGSLPSSDGSSCSRPRSWPPVAHVPRGPGRIRGVGTIFARHGDMAASAKLSKINLEEIKAMVLTRSESECAKPSFLAGPLLTRISAGTPNGPYSCQSIADMHVTIVVQRVRLRVLPQTPLPPHLCKYRSAHAVILVQDTCQHRLLKALPSSTGCH